MRRLWIRQGAVKPGPMASRAMQLEAAKEILAEVFHTRPGELEEMIQMRLVERRPEENIGPEKCGKKLWPAMFCVGE